MEAPTKSIVSCGYSIVPRDVLEIMGKKADGIIGEVPTAMRTPMAPTPAAQQWVQRFTDKWNHLPQAGSWAAYSGVKAWATAVAKVGNEKDHDAIVKDLETEGYMGEAGLW